MAAPLLMRLFAIFLYFCKTIELNNLDVLFWQESKWSAKVSQILKRLFIPQGTLGPFLFVYFSS